MNEFKTQALIDCIRQNPQGCDLKLSFFISTLIYKFDSCCRPRWLSKDLDEMTLVASRIPPLKEVVDNVAMCDVDVLKLLYWIFIELSGPRLELISEAEEEQIFEKLPQEGPPTIRPTHIFKVLHRDNKWKSFANASDFSTAFAFHGTKIFNYWNILHQGLQQHLNKVGLLIKI